MSPTIESAKHTHGPDCETCEGFCHYAGPVADAQSALDALRELVAVKQEREEISRRRQRRTHSHISNPEEVRAVKALHEACKVREYRAWNAAHSVIARITS